MFTMPLCTTWHFYRLAYVPCSCIPCTQVAQGLLLQYCAALLDALADALVLCGAWACCLPAPVADLIAIDIPLTEEKPAALHAHLLEACLVGTNCLRERVLHARLALAHSCTPPAERAEDLAEQLASLLPQADTCTRCIYIDTCT